MKLFVDTADLAEIRRIASYGILSGVTTNPSLMAKAGIEINDVTVRKHYKDICGSLYGDVSAEVISTEYESMLEEARVLHALHPRIVVKVPMIPDGVRALAQLHSEGIRTNCTLIFSAGQALLAAEAGATFISPFVGRLDDIGESGVELVEQICAVMHDYPDTQVLAASIRSTEHVVECAEAGADVASCPPAVFDNLFKHPLTDAGLERFLADYAAIQK